jgi:uncharacterized protein
MQFNVAQLLKQPTGAKREYDIDEPLGELDPELVAIEPIQGRVKFVRTRDGILVTGHLATELEVNCTRCLEAFDLPVEIEIEEEFKSTIDIRTGARVDVDTDETETLIDEHHIIDLSEVIRQDLLLALPLTPLCRPDCRGLCQSCGQNLNEGQCDCEHQTSDPRWNALADLLQRFNEDEPKPDLN